MILPLTRLLFCCAFLPTIPLLASPHHPIDKINRWHREEKVQTQGRYYKFATLAATLPDDQPTTCIIEIVNFHRKTGALFLMNRHVADALFAHPQVALNIWLPSTSRQVSMHGHLSETSPQEVAKSWKRLSRFTKLALLSPTESGEEEIACDDPLKPDLLVGYRFHPHHIFFYEMSTRPCFMKKESVYLQK